MNFKLHTQLGAKFKLVVRKVSDNSIARETDWFHNIVLDTGLARMSVGTWIDRCCIGTGNSTPVATQMALDNFIASTTTQQSSSAISNTTTAPYYYGGRITWRFGEGVAAGNISEVGLGWGNSNLWNRALIKDANGNPTTITVLSDEYLDVVSEIRVYPTQNLSGGFNLLDKTGAVISTHTYTGTPFFNSANSISFGRVGLGTDNNGNYIYISPATTTALVVSPSGTTIPYALSMSYPTVTSVRGVWTVGLSVANHVHQTFYVGINGLMDIGYYRGYRVQISPTITKNSLQVMTYTFELSWGRYTA